MLGLHTNLGKNLAKPDKNGVKFLISVNLVVSLRDNCAKWIENV